MLILYAMQSSFPIIKEFIDLYEKQSGLTKDDIVAPIIEVTDRLWSLKDPCLEYECNKPCSNRCLLDIDKITKCNLKNIMSPDDYLQNLIVKKDKKYITHQSNSSRDIYSISGD